MANRFQIAFVCLFDDARESSCLVGFSVSPKTTGQFSDTDGENLSNKDSTASDSSSDGSSREETAAVVAEKTSLLKYLTSGDHATKPSLIRQRSLAVVGVREKSITTELPLSNNRNTEKFMVEQLSSILTKQQLLAHNQMKLDRKFSLPTASYSKASPKSDASSSTSSACLSKESSDQVRRRVEQKRGSLQLGAFKSNVAGESTVDNGGSDNSNSSPTSDALKHDKKRKKSLPSGHQFENASNASNSDEPVPYIIRRKFSNGQVKVPSFQSP